MKTNPNKHIIIISFELDAKSWVTKIVIKKPMRDAIDKTNKDQDNFLLIINNLNLNIWY